MMPSAPPALSSATACAAENFPAEARGGSARQSGTDPREEEWREENAPAARSAKVIVRKKKRITRPMFLRSDARLRFVLSKKARYQRGRAAETMEMEETYNRRKVTMNQVMR